MMVQLSDERTKRLLGVMYNPRFFQNSLSIREITGIGARVIFTNDSHKVIRDTLVLTRGEHMGTLYKLDKIYPGYQHFYCPLGRSELFLSLYYVFSYINASIIFPKQNARCYVVRGAYGSYGLIL